ncbi:MAG: guanylate kinase [Lachnospiraceae bacterium]|jgi:guanylate kinase|nr:guanylate kinase [Lachnospiraceae bacterium]
MKRGILVVVSGFSGAGKGTLMKNLLLQHNDYALSISATTRKPRSGEEEGREYFFKTKEEFETMIENGDLIEYANYVGNYYGTPKDYVEDKLSQGKDVILEIELQGALKVKERFPKTLLLFVIPPSVSELKKRLIGRGTESEEVINARINRAKEESKYIKDYDYLIVNDDLNICTNELHQIIQNEHYRVNRNDEFVNQVIDELNRYK